MVDLFSEKQARRVYGFGLLLALVLMAATPVRSTVIVLLLLVYSLFFIGLSSGSFRTRERHYLYTWIIFGLAACFLGRFTPFLMSGFSGRYISVGVHMLAVIPVFMLLWRIYRPGDQEYFRRFIEYGSCFGAVGAAFLAVYQTQFLGLRQADGFLFSINFGFVSGMLFALCLAFVRRPVVSRGLLVLGVVSAAIAVVLSGARGAIFALPLLVVLWLIFNVGQLTWKRLILLLISIPLAVYLGYASVPMVKERTDRGLAEVASVIKGDVHEIRGGESLIYRVQLWIAAVEAVKQNPLFGMTYPEREKLNGHLVAEGVVIPWVADVSRGHAHSQYFETLATGGLVGLLALFVYLVLPAFYYLYSRFDDKDNEVALAGLLFTASVMIFGLTEVLLQQEMIATVYAFMQASLLVMCHRFRAPETSVAKQAIEHSVL